MAVENNIVILKNIFFAASILVARTFYLHISFSIFSMFFKRAPVMMHTHLCGEALQNCGRS